MAAILTRLRDGRSRLLFLAGAIGIFLLQKFHTSFSMGIRILFGQSSWRVKLTTQRHLLQKLRMTGARPPHGVCLLGAIMYKVSLTFIFKAYIKGRDG